MPTVSLGTFLKLSSMDAAQRERALRKYWTPGGYDFYWPVKAQATALTAKSRPYEVCEKAILSIKDEIKRKHNLLRLQALQKWVEKERSAGTRFFTPPAGKIISPMGHMTIKIEPQFGTLNGSVRSYVYLWNAKKPIMDAALSSIGNYLMSAYLIEDLFTEFRPVILDLYGSKLFATSTFPVGLGSLIKGDLEKIDEFFERPPPPSPPSPGAEIPATSPK